MGVNHRHCLRHPDACRFRVRHIFQAIADVDGPEMKTYAHLEHIIAFAVLGALFSFAYPRRPIFVCAIVLGGAALFEILQTLTPDRHGTMADALEKMAGGAAGILVAKGILQFGSARRPSS
jgi:VanZ family protein